LQTSKHVVEILHRMSDNYLRGYVFALYFIKMMETFSRVGKN